MRAAGERPGRDSGAARDPRAWVPNDVLGEKGAANAGGRRPLKTGTLGRPYSLNTPSPPTHPPIPPHHPHSTATNHPGSPPVDYQSRAHNKPRAIGAGFERYSIMTEPPPAGTGIVGGMVLRRPEPRALPPPQYRNSSRAAPSRKKRAQNGNACQRCYDSKVCADCVSDGPGRAAGGGDSPPTAPTGPGTAWGLEAAAAPSDGDRLTFYNTPYTATDEVLRPIPLRGAFGAWV